MPPSIRSSLSPAPDDAPLAAKRRKLSKPKSQAGGASNCDYPLQATEFQQVTREAFIKLYRIDGMGYGGDAYYQSDFLPPDVANRWYDEISQLDTWYQPTLKMYGRTFPQSRHVAAYATSPGLTLKYSGSDIVMNHPFPSALAAMQDRLEKALGVKFNHCMLNRYDDGGVYIGKHSDNLNNLVIASISLGAERTFIMSPRLPAKSSKGAKGLTLEQEEGLKGRANKKWKLANGSLVVMQGRTQEFWKHEIPKEASVKTGRISLTFRQLVGPSGS